MAMLQHHVQTIEDLLVVVAGHGLDEHAHGPGVSEADVGAADAPEGLAAEEIWVPVLAENHSAGVLVDVVLPVAEADQGQGE